jgi:hypothetical protein
MKPGHEGVDRVVVQLQRRADLLDPARAQHDDLVGHGHGLDLVVGDVDHGGLEPGMQVADLGAHRHAQLGVQVGQRLVEQEQLGFAHDGTADRHPLALAARELRGLALQQFAQAQQRGGGGHLGLDLRLGHPDVLQAEGHVVVHRHVRVQRIRLEHHRAAAVRRRHGVHALPVDADLAGGRRLQAGDHPQQRRLAAARGADEDHELTVVHRQVDAVQDGGLVKTLDDVLEFKCGHGRLLAIGAVISRRRWRCRW